MGHFGFSYVGLIYLLMLFIPNIIWSGKLPKGYDPSGENRVLLVLERVGQVLTTASALLFSDYNLKPFSAWTVWLIASFFLMMLYEVCWIRYFRNGRKIEDFYRGFLKIPVPLASLPVFAFFLLGIYGEVIWLVFSSVVLGIGHVGIHLQHRKELKVK